MVLTPDKQSIVTAGAHEPYDSVVAITEDYLGPAGGRFIDRQIQFHLGKRAESLTHDDLPKLVEWVKVSISLLTDDRKMVDDYTTRMIKLIG